MKNQAILNKDLRIKQEQPLTWKDYVKMGLGTIAFMAVAYPLLVVVLSL